MTPRGRSGAWRILAKRTLGAGLRLLRFASVTPLLSLGISFQRHHAALQATHRFLRARLDHHSVSASHSTVRESQPTNTAQNRRWRRSWSEICESQTSTVFASRSQYLISFRATDYQRYDTRPRGITRTSSHYHGRLACLCARPECSSAPHTNRGDPPETLGNFHGSYGFGFVGGSWVFRHARSQEYFWKAEAASHCALPTRFDRYSEPRSGRIWSRYKRQMDVGRFVNLHTDRHIHVERWIQELSQRTLFFLLEWVVLLVALSQFEVRHCNPISTALLNGTDSVDNPPIQRRRVTASSPASRK